MPELMLDFRAVTTTGWIAPCNNPISSSAPQSKGPPSCSYLWLLGNSSKAVSILQSRRESDPIDAHPAAASLRKLLPFLGTEMVSPRPLGSPRQRNVNFEATPAVWTLPGWFFFWKYVVRHRWDIFASFALWDLLSQKKDWSHLACHGEIGKKSWGVYTSWVRVLFAGIGWNSLNISLWFCLILQNTCWTFHFKIRTWSATGTFNLFHLWAIIETSIIVPSTSSTTVFGFQMALHLLSRSS